MGFENLPLWFGIYLSFGFCYLSFDFIYIFPKLLKLEKLRLLPVLRGNTMRNLLPAFQKLIVQNVDCFNGMLLLDNYRDILIRRKRYRLNVYTKPAESVGHAVNEVKLFGLVFAKCRNHRQIILNPNAFYGIGFQLGCNLPVQLFDNSVSSAFLHNK